MENYKYKKTNFPALLMKLVAMLAVSAFMAACNGGGGGGGAPAGVIASGANISNAAQVATVYSQNPMNGINMTLAAIVDNSLFINSTSMNLYVGPIAFTGTMTVQAQWTDITGGTCVVPAGTYTIQSYANGTMSAGMMTTKTVVIATPGNIIMEIVGGMINGNRLVALPPGGIHVSQANGVNCSPYFGGSFN